MVVPEQHHPGGSFFLSQQKKAAQKPAVPAPLKGVSLGRWLPSFLFKEEQFMLSTWIVTSGNSYKSYHMLNSIFGSHDYDLHIDLFGVPMSKKSFRSSMRCFKMIAIWFTPKKGLNIIKFEALKTEHGHHMSFSRSNLSTCAGLA